MDDIEPSGNSERIRPLERNCIEVVLCGAPYVGKTSIVTQLREPGPLPDQVAATIGIAVSEWMHPSGLAVRIHDVGGQLTEMTFPSLFRNADAIIYVCDVSRDPHVTTAETVQWKQVVDLYGGIGHPAFLFVNKIDTMVPSDRDEWAGPFLAVAQQYSFLGPIFTQATDHHSIRTAFNTVCDAAVAYKNAKPRRASKPLAEQRRKKSSCCLS